MQTDGHIGFLNENFQNFYRLQFISRTFWWDLKQIPNVFDDSLKGIMFWKIVTQKLSFIFDALPRIEGSWSAPWVRSTVPPLYLHTQWLRCVTALRKEHSTQLTISTWIVWFPSGLSWLQSERFLSSFNTYVRGKTTLAFVCISFFISCHFISKIAANRDTRASSYR